MCYSRDSANPRVSRPLFILIFIYNANVLWYGAAEQTQFDEDVARMSRGLSVPEYSFVLDLVSESLAPGTSEQDLSCLVHLSTLLLHETPEGAGLFIVVRISTLVLTRRFGQAQ